MLVKFVLETTIRVRATSVSKVSYYQVAIPVVATS